MGLTFAISLVGLPCRRSGFLFEGRDMQTVRRHEAWVIALWIVRWVLAGTAAATVFILGSPVAPAQPNLEPMIFFVAKGERNACGLGCSEWIAAEGMFDGPQ